MTEDESWQNGAVWYSDTLNITTSFGIEFTMNFGANSHGLGFEDFKPSLGVEFDTRENRIECNDSR